MVMARRCWRLALYKQRWGNLLTGSVVVEFCQSFFVHMSYIYCNLYILYTSIILSSCFLNIFIPVCEAYIAWITTGESGPWALGGHIWALQEMVKKLTSSESSCSVYLRVCKSMQTRDSKIHLVSWWLLQQFFQSLTCKRRACPKSPKMLEPISLLPLVQLSLAEELSWHHLWEQPNLWFDTTRYAQTGGLTAEGSEKTWRVGWSKLVAFTNT